MRKLFLILLLSSVVFACYGQPADVDIVYSGMIPQIVVWDDVDLDADGNPLIEGDVITYEIFFTREPFGENVQVSLGVVTDPEATIDLSALSRGHYYVGVRSIGEDAGGAIEVSAIAWSNDPMAVDPIQRFAYLVTGAFIPAVPSGLQAVGP